MNIYEKLQRARVKLQELDVKKSGFNEYAKYNYFTLGDMLPHINKIMDELKICSVISYGNEIATLTMVNSEKPEEVIVFTSPMSTINLKGNHDVQNLGAIQSYLRRYFYWTVFEIVESDEFDATKGKAEYLAKLKEEENKAKVGTNIKAPVKSLSDAQIKRLFAIGKTVGKNPKGILATAELKYGVKDLKNMSKVQYDEMCATLEGMRA